MTQEMSRNTSLILSQIAFLPRLKVLLLEIFSCVLVASPFEEKIFFIINVKLEDAKKIKIFLTHPQNLQRTHF